MAIKKDCIEAGWNPKKMKAIETERKRNNENKANLNIIIS